MGNASNNAVQIFARLKPCIMSDIIKQHSEIIPAAEDIRSNNHVGHAWRTLVENGAYLHGTQWEMHQTTQFKLLPDSNHAL